MPTWSWRRLRDRAKGGKGIRKRLDERLEEVKRAKGYKNDTELTADDSRRSSPSSRRS